MKPHLDDITVFLISTGEETSTECEKALIEQDCSFTVKHIKDTFPMYRAFQRMPDECDTRYFLQVDSDMILKPHAVKTLYDGIKKSFPLTYMVLGQLYEDGIGISGAVKCWKKQLFNYFRFRDCRTVDRDIYRRTRMIGLRRKDLRQVLGIHVARNSSFTKYLKTKSDIEKRRFLKISPKRQDLALLNRCIENLPDTSYELLGALLGALTMKERLVRSKNIELETERYNEVMGFLGIEQECINISNIQADLSTLNNLFCKSYKDINDNHSNTKLELTSIVIKIFGSKSNANPSELLKIVTR